MSERSSAGGGRLHAPVLVAKIGEHPDPHRELDWKDLYVGAVGWWRPLVSAGQIVQTGDTIGELTVLGVAHRVVAGPGIRGVVLDQPPGQGAVAIHGGRPLFTVDEALANAGAVAGAREEAAAVAGGGLSVRAPSSGRFYGRPGPGKPAFVSVGDVIREGHTVCLLEVMKTFHRVTYGGAGMPGEARVTAIAVADEADVNSGDVLLHLEMI